MSLSSSVPNLQNRKRLDTDDITKDVSPVKRIKSASNFSPKFWDDLSKVWLTPRALREIDRRNHARPPLVTTPARCSRRGGPDLSHLRGYPEPKHAARIRPNCSSASSSQQTWSISVSSEAERSFAKRSSAYDEDFEQHLMDYGVFPEGFQQTEPSNLEDILKVFSNPRASLSPSHFSAIAFENFKLANSRVVSKSKVLGDILAIICGNADIPNEGTLPFSNLDSIIDGITLDTVPDSYDGSYPSHVDKAVRQNLSKMIIPTRHEQAPLAPNFFVEAKAPLECADVTKRQACLDGAIGARAMHCLQTYGADKPVYDGNAHTFSSTYHDGVLRLYAHHVCGPTTGEERPEYHMTKVRGFDMTDSRETFVAGATAFRNARELAQRERDAFIHAANLRARQAATIAELRNMGDTCDKPEECGLETHSETMP